MKNDTKNNMETTIFASDAFLHINSPSVDKKRFKTAAKYDQEKKRLIDLDKTNAAKPREEFNEFDFMIEYLFDCFRQKKTAAISRVVKQAFYHLKRLNVGIGNRISFLQICNCI